MLHHTAVKFPLSHEPCFQLQLRKLLQESVHREVAFWIRAQDYCKGLKEAMKMHHPVHCDVNLSLRHRWILANLAFCIEEGKDQLVPPEDVFPLPSPEFIGEGCREKKSLHVPGTFDA